MHVLSVQQWLGQPAARRRTTAHGQYRKLYRASDLSTTTSSSRTCYMHCSVPQGGAYKEETRKIILSMEKVRKVRRLTAALCV